MELTTIQSLVHKHNVQLRLLDQIEHFTRLKEVKLDTLAELPVAMPKTARLYKRSIDKYTGIINGLTKSYKNIK